MESVKRNMWKGLPLIKNTRRRSVDYAWNKKRRNEKTKKKLSESRRERRNVKKRHVERKSEARRRNVADQDDEDHRRQAAVAVEAAAVGVGVVAAAEVTVLHQDPGRILHHLLLPGLIHLLPPTVRILRRPRIRVVLLDLPVARGGEAKATAAVVMGKMHVVQENGLDLPVRARRVVIPRTRVVRVEKRARECTTAKQMRRNG